MNHIIFIMSTLLDIFERRKGKNKTKSLHQRFRNYTDAFMAH